MQRSFYVLAIGLLSFVVCAQLAAQQPPDDAMLENADALAMEDAEDEEEEIETDRDSFTPAVTTTGAGFVIVESAYTFIDNRNVPETHSVPETLIRIGTTDWLELRVGWNYEVGGAGSPVSGNVPSDFDAEAEIETESRMLYGFKAWLTEQQDWIPQSVVMLQGYTPTGGEATDTEMSATYVVGYVLPHRIAWDSAIRYSTDGEREDNFSVWAPSTVVKVPIGERWKVHAEYFGIFSTGRERETVQHYFSPGAHYLITKNLEVGARFGWGLNEQSANFFANTGVGWRF